ncbi:MAG: hypothetical protein KDC34_15600 [Saprospiraceae bacterium]|nr:hypothetical protein [Saprospiraceae bacterium]
MSCLLVACEPDMESKEEVTQDVAPAGEAEMLYDAALAAKLGADEYGMKSYVMAFLKAGPNRSQDSLEAARLQSAHLANISRMAKAGDLVMAGPFMDDGAVRGIYIFDVETVEEAEALTSTDPAIQAGRLVMELHPWYGSAALVELNTRHQQIQKTQF